MRFLISAVLAVPLLAALGDKAPAIPSSYKSSHPRLGKPDATYLNNVWSGRSTGRPTGSKYMFDAADAWTTASGETYWDCRWLISAYMADALNSGPNHAAYLTKIKAMSKAAFGGSFSGSVCIATAYDWLYDELDATTKANWLADIQSYSSDWESANANNAASPYNDVGYINSNFIGMPLAVVQYPDGGATSLAHLRYAMDYMFNIQLPVWKQLLSTGCWHETWEYINGTIGLPMGYQIGTSMLAWATATNNYPGFFTANPWLKNIATCAIYMARPDMTLERINGSANGGYIRPEYDARVASDFGVLELIGEAYSDPILRGWARLINWRGTTPTGFEPSAWPYLSPDSSAKSTAAKTSLPKVKNFDGWGVIFRTGWGEDDTFATFKCADNYWSHNIQDQGAFTIFSRGGLAIRSGSYQPGSASPHYYMYGKQLISQNGLLVTDPADTYPSETVTLYRNDGSTSSAVLPNEGGQRRVGSGYQIFGTSLQQAMSSPYDIAEWTRNREIYHACTNVGFATNTGYSYAAIDMTAAYNNLWSRNAHTVSGKWDEANTSNRTYRVRKAVRHMVWIPRGTSAYVVVYDQVDSTNSAFTKKWLLHSIEQPTVSGNHYTVTRNRSVTLKPFDLCGATYGIGYGLTHCSGGTYSYAGQLDGYMTLPTGSIAMVGGTGQEFLVNGVNYNECMQDQCGLYDYQAMGNVVGYITPDVTVGESEPGAWRIEQTPTAAATTDYFLNVMLARSVSDTNVISTAPITTDDGNGNWSTTWKDNGNTCTYTLVLPKSGVGGTLTTSGSGCSTVIP